MNTQLQYFRYKPKAAAEAIYIPDLYILFHRPDMCQTMYSAGEEKQVQLVMCGIMKDYGKSATEYKFYLDDGKVYKGQECKWLQQQLLVYNGLLIKIALSNFSNSRRLNSNPSAP